MTNSTSRERILLVEDEELIASMLEEYFSLVAPELELEIAKTLAEAREKLKDGSWAVCICDCRLPDGSACELFLENAFSCPVIITTGYVEEREIARVKEHINYPVYIFKKPYHPADLYRKIREILGS